MAERVPSDVWGPVAARLGPADLVRAGSACRELRDAARREAASRAGDWRARVVHRDPETGALAFAGPSGAPLGRFPRGRSLCSPNSPIPLPTPTPIPPSSPHPPIPIPIPSFRVRSGPSE